MHKQRGALEIGNGLGARVTAVPTLLYSTLQFLNLPCMHVCSRHNNLLFYDYMYFLYQSYSQQPALSLSKIPFYFLVPTTVIK